MGFEDRGEQLDGFKAMLALQERFDVQTTSSILQALLEVVKPTGIKGDKDMVSGIMGWETLLGTLENRFGEVLSENLRTAILVGMLPKDHAEMVIEKGILMGGGKLKYQESRDYLIKMAKEKTDRGKVTPMELGAADIWGGGWEGFGGLAANGGGGYGIYDHDMVEGGEIGAIGKGGGCWLCGGNHFQRECPLKGKGKGKGDAGKGPGEKGGTKGDWWKGKGKGMMPTWNFGDKGKGKGVLEAKGGDGKGGGGWKGGGKSAWAWGPPPGLIMGGKSGGWYKGAVNPRTDGWGYQGVCWTCGKIRHKTSECPRSLQEVSEDKKGGWI